MTSAARSVTAASRAPSTSRTRPGRAIAGHLVPQQRQRCRRSVWDRLRQSFGRYGHVLHSRGNPFTSAGNQSFAGSGTVASPYKVTTTVTLTSPTGNVPAVLQLTEVDSYIVGDNFYQTDVTVTNIGSVTLDNGGELYHAGDCFLRGSNTGLGAFEPNSATPNTAPARQTSSAIRHQHSRNSFRSPPVMAGSKTRSRRSGGTSTVEAS